MPNAKAFTNGFSKGFGFNRIGGQMLLIVGPHPTYEDGDVLVAKNRRATRCVHAEHICWRRHPSTGLKVGGFLGTTEPLLEIMQSNCCQYKWERVSASEIKRTNLWTLGEIVYGSAPIEDPTPSYHHHSSEQIVLIVKIQCKLFCHH